MSQGKSWWLDAILARLEEANKSWLKTRDASCASTKTDREPSATKKELEKLANGSKIRTSHWASTRAVCRALFEQKLKNRMSEQPLRAGSTLLQESSHRQEDLTKAQTNFETAKEKEVRQLEELEQARWRSKAY